MRALIRNIKIILLSIALFLIFASCRTRTFTISDLSGTYEYICINKGSAKGQPVSLYFLTLNTNRTFEFGWIFDLASYGGQGTWQINSNRINLKFAAYMPPSLSDFLTAGDTFLGNYSIEIISKDALKLMPDTILCRRGNTFIIRGGEKLLRIDK